MKKMHKRYGEFQITDYMGSWMVLCLMAVFTAMCLLLELSPIYMILPILHLVISVYSIWSPNREWFEITDDIIIVKKGKRKQQIPIPKELSIIISPVDICPMFSVRTAIGNKTHILKEKYAVSLLRKMDMDEIMNRVHQGYIKQYTTSTIKNAFEEYKYYYSFVYSDILLNEILRDRNVNILIPESMIDKISIKKQVSEIVIDPKC